MRRKVISSLVVAILCTGLLLWHGTSFPLAVVSACAILYFTASILSLRRLRTEADNAASRTE
jgi:hypothetical protein